MSKKKRDRCHRTSFFAEEEKTVSSPKNKTKNVKNKPI